MATTNNSVATGANPGDATSASKLMPYSIGIVAANKELGSKDIEVTPIEAFPMLSGEISDNISTIETKGTSADGTSYEHKLKTTNSIKATWIPMFGANRLTAPDVRRGELVQIYQFGDVDKYYWATLKDDLALRKLETVIWAFSNTRIESDVATHDTTYYIEVSTHNKIIHLHMADNDGEVTTYDMQFNGKEGYFVIQDGIGNYIKLNSIDKQFHIETAEGSFIDITKGDLHIKLSGKYLLEVPTTIEKTNRTQTGDATLNGSALVNGAATTTGLQTAGGLSVKGGVGTGASAKFEGSIQLAGSLTGSGNISTTGTVHGTNI